MKIVTIVSKIDVIGYGWYNQVMATTYSLSSHDVEIAKNDDGQLTHESVGNWLMSHSGDFQQVIDWRATIGDAEFDCDWGCPDESELTWNDCLYGNDEF